MVLGHHHLPTTYIYEPLHTARHIRLLHIDHNTDSEQQSDQPLYSLIQCELSDDQFDFEAISYQWGDQHRVSALVLQNAEGTIGLTANLTEALPHLAQSSKTKRLWIDQICINQSDDKEKVVQIGLMADVYKRATGVIVWLGPEDNSSRICREWLHTIEQFISTVEAKDKITRGSPTYWADTRGLFLKSSFYDQDTDPKFTPAIQNFWQRSWFTRGWICQEFLLAKEITCLTGKSAFTLLELTDLFAVPDSDDNIWISHRCLMWLKQFPFTDPAPRNYLRILSAIAGEFDTTKYVDKLFGCLGIMEGLNFVPDYNLSILENFTKFAITLARDYGSLDFLSLWSWNLDHLVLDTPDEIRALQFPSWVPSWTPRPLSAPFRLATGGARQYRSEITWDAVRGRKHVHVEHGEDTVVTRRLHVRGKIIDYIDAISDVKFARYWDVDEDYLTTELIDKIKPQIPGLDSWTYKDLINFLNIASANGIEPLISTEDLFKPASHPFRNMSGRTESLGVCLSMGRGRRVIRTEKGHLGLAPALGSRAKTDASRGTAIGILHGCIVPLVLEISTQEENEWKVIGDCYLEGMMKGEAVNWEEGEADEFILV